MVLVVKTPAANAGDVKDGGLIPGSERSTEGGHGKLLQHSAWRILWTEQPGRLQPMRPQRVGHD